MNLQSTDTIDMRSWGYVGLETDRLRYDGLAGNGWRHFTSTYDPNASPSSNGKPWAREIFMDGGGLRDLDSNGVPHTGGVTGITIYRNPYEHAVFAVSEMAIPVDQVLSAISGASPTLFNAATLIGNDIISGSSTDIVDSNGIRGDYLFGAGGDDTISGRGGHDTIMGGDGQDMILVAYYEGTWASVFDGGSGVDMIAYLDAKTPVVADLTAGTAGLDKITNFENLQGSIYSDKLTGTSGANFIQGSHGDDTIDGGAGQDFLRGWTGADQIFGGDDFDDTHGNMGDDSIWGGKGDDWVVGGQDNDLLLGEAGDDIVYGNLGNDTCLGGAGADWVRGGQGDDTLSGGDGDDWMAGDRGSDTISGGAGADRFYATAGAGLDRIVDFSLTEGDKIQLDPGTVRTVRFENGDTIVDLGGGDRVVLVGVAITAPQSDWIVG